MRKLLPIEDWVIMESKYKELPFGKDLLDTLEKVTWKAELLYENDSNDIASQRQAWNSSTRDIHKNTWGNEMFQELLLLLTTMWELGEWFFMEVLSPLEQQVFYSVVEERMQNEANRNG